MSINRHLPNLPEDALSTVALDVTDVTWLDDAIDIKMPLEVADKDTVETYYKDNATLFSVTVDEESMVDTVASIRELIG